MDLVAAAVPRVNRAEPIAAVDREGIEWRHYSLEGGLPFERYVLELTEGGWSVPTPSEGFGQVRSTSIPSKRHANHLFLALVGDPNTRRP
jgi:hypothetical protein